MSSDGSTTPSESGVAETGDVAENVDLVEIAELAVTIAEGAGRILLEERPDSLEVDTKSTATDVVTEMDARAERWIVEQILAARPDDGILGEEDGEHKGSSGVRWVIDPLDGTVNYLYRIPIWAVSIGVEIAGEVKVGVVRVPALDETYQGIAGQGAWLGRERADAARLGVSGATDLAQSLIGTGFGYSASRRAVQARVLLHVITEVRDIRRPGAAAIDLCWVARGLLDGYYERGLKPWDLAAGGLIAREAGAVVSGLHGMPASEALTVASSPAIHGSLVRLLQEQGADSD